MSFFNEAVSQIKTADYLTELCETHRAMFPTITLQTPEEVEAIELAAEEMSAAVANGKCRQYLCWVLEDIGRFVEDQKLKAATETLVKRIGKTLKGDQEIDFSLDEYLYKYADPAFYELPHASQLLIRLFWIDQILEGVI